MTENLGIDMSSTIESKVEVLEHKRGRALGHDKSISKRIVGTGSFLWSVIALCEGSECAKRAERQRENRRVTRPSNCHLRLP